MHFPLKKPCVLSVLRFAVVLIFFGVVGRNDDPLWSDRARLNILHPSDLKGFVET